MKNCEYVWYSDQQKSEAAKRLVDYLIKNMKVDTFLGRSLIEKLVTA
jgi:hypothetical protein